MNRFFVRKKSDPLLRGLRPGDFSRHLAFCPGAAGKFRRVGGSFALWLLLAFWLASLPCGRGAEPEFHAATGFSYDSNLSNASRAGDVYDDFFWNAEGGATWRSALDRDWRASAGVYGGVEVPFEYRAFTLARAGVDARLTRKFGLGQGAPSLTAGGFIERDFFQQTEMSKWFFVPSLRWTQPFGGDWSADILYRFDGSAAGSNLFSGYGNEGGLTLRWRPEGRWSFSAGYRLRYGDVVSFATPPRADILAVSSVVQRGNTFFGRTLTAYRLQALTQSFILGAGYALTGDISLQATGEFQHTSRSAITYDAFLAQLSLKTVF